MAPYYPLYIRRSDGKFQIKAHGKPETNEPTSEQLDQSPNAQGVCDFYRICKADDPKLLDWRRKLGGMLIRELQAKEEVNQSKNFILSALPENYRLYEHIKYKTNPDSEAKNGKNHAAGANDRQDAYLYGHPSGRKKRYRSPNEFFPHLLWLATDEQGDSNNCSCKFCTPEEMDTGEKDKENKPRATSSIEPTESKPKGPALSRPSDVLKQPPKERKPPVQQQALAQQSQLNRITPNYPQSSNRPPSKSLEPTILPRFRSMEQRLDCQSQKHLYRPGDIVWFKKGMAWGLGAVARRENAPNASLPYRVQPLSHPFDHPKQISLPQTDLRPWLAWSPPPTTAVGLRPDAHNGFRTYRYDTVDWNQYMQGSYGAGDAEVDGSILAAKTVELTYTPFDVISANPIPNTPQPQGQETHYNGVFIGAEKVWVGDALRLRSSQFATDIMVLHDIIERPMAFSGSGHTVTDPNKMHITLVGDTFTIAIAELQPTNVPKDTLHLPSRVREDLTFKNELTSKKADPNQRYTSFWHLTQKSVHLAIDDIKGRWYETRILLPILNPKVFAERQIVGDVPDACGYMNGQGDCNRPPSGAPGVQVDPNTGLAKSQPAEMRIDKRERAFGRSVPTEFSVHRGLDERSNAPRPGSSGGNGGPGAEARDWMDAGTSATSSRPPTRPGSTNSAATGGSAMVSTPGTDTSMGIPGFGQDYGSQGNEEKEGLGLFQEAPEGLGDMNMGQG